ncbi:MAG TPA: copper-binding protein [Casimicrobiaceae bacterium]|nr:copper-binding protein [Casimicrobiaceae bacterium]
MKEVPAASTTKDASHTTTGTVKKVDSTRGMVTLDHAPVASMKWPAMTMEFEVADKKMLDDLKAGSSVQVRFREKSKGKYVITELKR